MLTFKKLNELGVKYTPIHVNFHSRKVWKFLINKIEGTPILKLAMVRWSEASFSIFGGTLFFDFFISCVVKIHEKMTYLTFVSIVILFHFVDF